MAQEWLTPPRAVHSHRIRTEEDRFPSDPGIGPTSDDRERLKELVAGLAASGTSVLLTDHDADIVLGAAERVLAMNQDTVLALGSADAVRNDPKVIAAYVGLTSIHR